MSNANSQDLASSSQFHEGAASVPTQPPSYEELARRLQESDRQRATLERENGELRSTVRRLERYRDRYVDLYESAPVGYVCVDQDGRVQEMNRVAAQMLGADHAAITGSGFAEHVVQEDRDVFRGHLQRCVREQREAISEMKLVARGGRDFQARLHSSPVQSLANGATICKTVIVDLTERRRAEEERERLLITLEQRNAELERFAYTVSHDLKSPLITIRGHLGLLQADVASDDPEQVQQDVAYIAEATDRMNRLLQDVMELLRAGRLGQPEEEMPLEQLVRDALVPLAERIGARNVVVQIGADLPIVRGDLAQLRQFLGNLLENALKFLGDQPQPKIEIGVRRDGDEPVLYIRDNGIGIDPQYQERIFRLFEKLDPGNQGTGVGLALARRIAENHGSRLWVESEGVGRGSAFCFTPPRS